MNTTTDLGIFGAILPILVLIFAYFWAIPWGGLRFLPGFG